MKTVSKSVLLSHSPEEMYALVTDVARYAEFLPWCDRSEVLASTDHEMTAKVGMSLGGLRQSFTTANRHEPDRAVHMQLIEGPFSHLRVAGNLRRWARLTMRGVHVPARSRLAWHTPFLARRWQPS